MSDESNEGIDPSEGLRATQEIRDQFGIETARIIAYAEIEIDSEADELVAISGIDSPPGIVGAPANRRFQTFATPPGHNRDFDAEVKLLEEIAARLESSSTGVVKLFSELDFCDSREDVIGQFQSDFPNVNVIPTHASAKRNTMSELDFDRLKSRLQALNGSEADQVEGADEHEIDGLEYYAGGSLPKVYKKFLKTMGRSTGSLFRGTDCCLDQRFRLRLREHAEKLLQGTTAAFELPSNAFVFLLSQGTQFTYFLLSDGDDPPVYHYSEADDQPVELSEHLSDYFQECVTDCERWAARRAARSVTSSE